jgi:hypothetical protein
MKEESKQLVKKCPVCAREYTEEDYYCGDDGSLLEQDRVLSGNQSFRSVAAPFAADDIRSEPDNALQH